MSGHRLRWISHALEIFLSPHRTNFEAKVNLVKKVIKKIWGAPFLFPWKKWRESFYKVQAFQQMKWCFFFGSSNWIESFHIVTLPGPKIDWIRRYLSSARSTKIENENFPLSDRPAFLLVLNWIPAVLSWFTPAYFFSLLYGQFSLLYFINFFFPLLSAETPPSGAMVRKTSTKKTNKKGLTLEKGILSKVFL